MTTPRLPKTRAGEVRETAEICTPNCNDDPDVRHQENMTAARSKVSLPARNLRAIVLDRAKVGRRRRGSPNETPGFYNFSGHVADPVYDSPVHSPVLVSQFLCSLLGRIGVGILC